MSKKLIALLLAGIFTFGVMVPAQAATVEELQAQIAALLAQINALQAQLANKSASFEMVCFNTDLKLGMKSDDVKNLQIKLGVTPVTGYFGPITLAAVKSFQKAHGIITTGYVGPLTRAALNELYCVPPTTTTTVAPESTTTTTTVAPSYGTLSVTSYPLSSSVTNLYGNNTYEVLAGQYKATGSDITLKKVAVKLAATSAFPWQYFTSVSLWDGSTKLGETAVTQSNLIENSFANEYTANISGLNYVIPAGTSKVLAVKVTVVPTVVNQKDFTFTLVNTQTVFTDTAGVTYTNAGDDFSSSSFTVKNANTATITITPASDNPSEGNVIGSTSNNATVDLLKFNVKVDDVNVTLNSASATVYYTGDAQLSSLELWDGSTRVASAAAPTSDSDGAVSWTNFTLPISAGTTKTLTIKGVLKQLTTDYAGGDTVMVSDPTLHGMDSNSNAIEIYGTVAGNDQHIYLVAPTITLLNVTSCQKYNPDSGPSTCEATIKFTVTANNGDIYIHDETEKLGTNKSGTNMYGVTVNVNGANTVSSTYTYTSDATHDDTNDYYTVYAGTTKTFTVSVHLVGNNAYASANVSHIYWTASSTIAAASGNTSGYEDLSYGLTDFKTDNIYLEAN